ncbi:SRPBCC domain-containing protein [Alkalihalobacillus pseudalcaliphilus]|uniref:SRPBCC domain-containing protein n=1 Tax=Alkalihalobacillus pseudalcaliphilus TaxID=79884 RepID=UPI00064DFB4F|nr:SRPBCC domain-containing protein [Alkalihalobacillus pseudalcaliphilus]KMK76816.1 hypothetical protein AB990_07880 [Alkalihalobacillus pseudalcaliphilus]
MNSSNRAQKDIFIFAPPSRIWQALTIPEQRNKWETKSCEIDLTVGGKVFFDYGWNVTYSGTIKDFTENEKLVLEDEEQELTTWTIKETDGGSIVSIEYTGQWLGEIGLSQMENMLFGTYQFMLNLKEVEEGRQDIRHNFWKSWIGTLHHTEGKYVKIVKVIPHTPAAEKLIEGDYLLAIDGTTVHHYDEAELAITHADVKTTFELTIARNEKTINLSLETIPFGTVMSS